MASSSETAAGPGARAAEARPPALAGARASRRDEVAFGQERHALHDVVELADIARPRVGQKPRLGIGREALGTTGRSRRRRARGIAAQERARRCRAPAGAGAAASTRPAGGRGPPGRRAAAPRPEIGVGGADDPRVHGLGACGPEPAHGLLLQHLEQLRLERLRQEPDLVEKDGAAVSGLEEARL